MWQAHDEPVPIADGLHLLRPRDVRHDVVEACGKRVQQRRGVVRGQLCRCPGGKADEGSVDDRDVVRCVVHIATAGDTVQHCLRECRLQQRVDSVQLSGRELPGTLRLRRRHKAAAHRGVYVANDDHRTDREQEVHDDTDGHAAGAEFVPLFRLVRCERVASHLREKRQRDERDAVLGVQVENEHHQHVHAGGERLDDVDAVLLPVCEGGQRDVGVVAEHGIAVAALHDVGRHERDWRDGAGECDCDHANYTDRASAVLQLRRDDVGVKVHEECASGREPQGVSQNVNRGILGA
mmetsp:Transcript_17447/g.54123  ORF Transcript_17447/g.54123 Transcript_17447/m.54123 type:complete len:294 (-) Transcript_17447:274-1155(-)